MQIENDKLEETRKQLQKMTKEKECEVVKEVRNGIEQLAAQKIWIVEELELKIKSYAEAVAGKTAPPNNQITTLEKNWVKPTLHTPTKTTDTAENTLEHVRKLLQNFGTDYVEDIKQALKTHNKGLTEHMQEEDWRRGYTGIRVVQCNNLLEGEVNKAAVVVFDNNIRITQFPALTTTNVVTARLSTECWDVIVVSYYFEPGKDISLYLKQLGDIVSTVKQRIILGGDANAKNPWWGGSKVDRRGLDFEASVNEWGLHILNRMDRSQHSILLEAPDV
ncbi:unnamed protein product [Pieris macdunnoughi]|uniref:Endonuclease/exonuclease/phosphatase domain-containing protein n=1 Tax=Pieris macdunnoughi TaxID=345717 RepID=A0A821X7R1_9NEOP|nr:unnamed protein product [Pieris macdunnoughi]